MRNQHFNKFNELRYIAGKLKKNCLFTIIFKNFEKQKIKRKLRKLLGCQTKLRKHQGKSYQLNLIPSIIKSHVNFFIFYTI